MASYLIGDIHGCSRTLARLLTRLPLRAGRDRLLLTGDLVNRGPDSLGVLRWAMEQGGKLVCVLGNHDLQLLGQAWEIEGFSPAAALQEVLDAPDAERILQWLRMRPLLVQEQESGALLVHAGLLPAWTAQHALQVSARCEELLRGPKAPALLHAMKKLALEPAAESSPEFLEPASFLRVVSSLRVVDAQGAMVPGFTGALEERPPGTRAWFMAEERRTRGQRVLFGHWARLGLLLREDAWCLDSACVWGKALSAVRLDDGKVFQEPFAEEAKRS
ncbi:MAG TPA: symmetrical bis(5'-nucleosyl)-tetraphosphatase [Candidatus Krumholzibacteria bacterium]|nr:symmetrical bis(5'-nucleosyl)-tetraphosphatase [Candidatus Krumholzibacteria bacterium]